MTMPESSGTVDGSGYVWLTFQPGDEVSVALEQQGDERIGWTAPGEEQGYESDDGEVTAAVINNVVGENSQLTAETNGAVVAFHGRWSATDEWAVLLRGKGMALLWVTGTGGAAPGGLLGLSFLKAVTAGTIGVPAAAPSLLAVGCALNRVTWRPLGMTGSLRLASFGGVEEPEADSMCYFSAAGPTPAGLMKPELTAPGAFVAAAMSRDADPRVAPGSMFDAPGCPEPEVPCYLVDDTHALTSGTSMAAPHAAGAAALLLQREPWLTQQEVTDILQAGAAFPQGAVPMDYQLGPGELDLEGAHEVLEAEQNSVTGVDASQSYVVLSSPYLRPDPDWPVQGSIQLRQSDGSVALGAAPEELSVAIDGGIVRQGSSRVRAGLFRFEIAAPRGSGGSRLWLDVRYRGVKLDVRELPVGVDTWAAGSTVEALGGTCALPGPSRVKPARWALLGLAALGLRRRRRRRQRWRSQPVP